MQKFLYRDILERKTLVKGVEISTPFLLRIFSVNIYFLSTHKYYKIYPQKNWKNRFNISLTKSTD